MKVRVFYKPDGTVSIRKPQFKMRLKGETDDECWNREVAKNMKKYAGLEYEDMDESALPQTERKYRDAWTGSGGNGISIDPVKKAEIDARPVYSQEQEMQIRSKMCEMAIEELGF